MEIIDPTQPAAPIQAPSAFSPQQSQGNRKKYIVIGIGITLLMLVVGIGSYFLGMKSGQAFIAVRPQSDAPPVVDPLPSRVPTPTTNPTTGWRTYLNKDWNLTIKYPPHLFEKDYNDLVYFTFEPEPTEGWGMMGAPSDIRISKVDPFSAPGLKFDALSKAIVGSDVKVHYTGYLKDGKIFDSSILREEPIAFKVGVGMVIKGWDEGILLMRQGAKFRFIIPSGLAYGNQEAGGGVIPADSELTFDCELVEVK